MKIKLTKGQQNLLTLMNKGGPGGRQASENRRHGASIVYKLRGACAPASEKAFPKATLDKLMEHGLIERFGVCKIVNLGRFRITDKGRELVVETGENNG